MKGRVNQFIFKKGLSPLTITEMTKTFYKGKPCVLVYDNNNCVGIIFEHYESRKVPANGQAEIRFFEKYHDAYGKWHRVFMNGERLKYVQLLNRLGYMQSVEYSGYIKE